MLGFLKRNPNTNWVDIAKQFDGCTRVSTTKEFQIFMQILLENGNIKLNKNLRPEVVDIT